MPYEFTISLRYLKSRRRQAFISLISFISVGGVAVGVMVLIIVLAVMSGFETSLKEKILGMNSHIWILPQTTQLITDYQDIITRTKTIPHVTRVTPFTTHEVMLMADGRVAGTIVRGIDPDDQDHLADLKQYFDDPDLSQLFTPETSETSGNAPTASGRGIVLGSELARSLLVFPRQAVVVNSPMGVLTPAGICQTCDALLLPKHSKPACMNTTPS